MCVYCTYVYDEYVIDVPVHRVPVSFWESEEIGSDPEGSREERERITIIP